tara:strand:- start:93 stop:806 length:714 start_codon:yes stop_codon:yes gene_type:complete
MKTISFNKVRIITVAKVGSANFLKCGYSQSTNIKHTHSLYNFQNILNNESNCLIIVGIRNPIDRNLSYLFQTYKSKQNNMVRTKTNNYIGEKCYISEMVNNKSITSEKIINLYFKQNYHNTFNEWFEEFLDITKINTFNKERGLDFYNIPNNNTIMIYTMEKLTENHQDIIDTLGITGTFTNVNNSKRRRYCKIYNDVKEKIEYKKEYLDTLLNTDIMKLFYNENDIKYFYSKLKIN